MINEEEQKEILTDATQVNVPDVPAPPPLHPRFLMPQQAARMMAVQRDVEMAQMQLQLAQSEYQKTELSLALEVGLDATRYDLRVQMIDQAGRTLGFMPREIPGRER